MAPTNPNEMMAAVEASMATRTGHTLAHWVKQVGASGVDPLDQNAVRRWLRDTHGIKQNTQWAIAREVARRAGWVEPSAQDTADALYAGKRAALRPLHDAVLALARILGPDVTIEARATYAPIVRRTQLAAVAPGPRGTLRVGFRFRERVPADPRLEPAKGFAQATHWLHLSGDTQPSAVRTLESLLEAAYEQNG